MRKKIDKSSLTVYSKSIMKILLINGPNLQLLGRRKPEIYGTGTLQEIEASLRSVASELQIELDCMQSNHEGVIVDAIADAIGKYDGIVINPAAYTHTSVAIRDALEAAQIPAMEVHMSNIAGRDEFRHRSLTAPMCVGQITGLGGASYEWA